MAHLANWHLEGESRIWAQKMIRELNIWGGRGAKPCRVWGKRESTTAGASGCADRFMGAITGNGEVTVSATSISNTQSGQLSGASLHVQGNTLDNSGGTIGNVTNSNGDVEVTTTGAITNTNGQISSTHDLSVTAATLQGGGTYSATHDANVNLQGDYTAAVDTQFNVGHDFAFTLPGTFTNNANLQSVNNLSVNAGRPVNMWRTTTSCATALLHWMVSVASIALTASTSRVTRYMSTKSSH